jgi:enamine deaminase RidA (YjgF/YER057c/UK114 family)
LGIIVCPKQWKAPVNDSGDVIKKVSQQKKTREFMDNIDDLVHHIFSSPEHAEQKQIWLDILQDYREAMKILR